MIANLNYVHILVAALIYFVIGALWYSLLFQKPWMKLVGATGEMSEADKKKMPLMFASTFVMNFIITFATACIVYAIQPATLIVGVKIGLLLGVGFVGTTSAMNNMYARRPFQLTMIDSGYHIVSITIATILLQMWH